MATATSTPSSPTGIYLKANPNQVWINGAADLGISKTAGATQVSEGDSIQIRNCGDQSTDQTTSAAPRSPTRSRPN